MKLIMGDTLMEKWRDVYRNKPLEFKSTIESFKIRHETLNGINFKFIYSDSYVQNKNASNFADVSNLL
jgi:hypothetical protein